MRQVFFFVIFILFLFTIFFIESFYQPIKKEDQKIQVQIVYHEKSHHVEVEAYSTLEEALKQINLEDDVLESAINFQQILSHRDVINIPLIQEIQCISINYADLEGLSSIKGIGPKTAESIIEFRQTYGPFQELEDLLAIKGIGEKKLEAMRAFICL